MAALRAVLSNPDLRRLELTWAGTSTGNWAFAIAIVVWAYGEGGATLAGVTTVARMLPAAVAAPMLGQLADRHPRRQVMLLADVACASALALAAVAMAAGAAAAVVIVLAAAYTLATTAFKPAQAALLPVLARTPGELAAANVAQNGIDNAGFLAGSGLGGALLAASSPQAVLGLSALAFAGAAALLLRIGADARPEPLAGEAAGALRAAAAGMRAIASDARLRLLFTVLGTAFLVEGASEVLIVVVAIEQLDLGRGGVGAMNALWGLGGIAGGAVALVLLSRARLAAGLSSGAILFGAPFVAIGLTGSASVALALMVVVGIGFALVETAGMTLVQRLPSDGVLAQTFGALESVYVGAFGLGGLLAAGAIAAFGIEGALVALGALVPALALARWARLAQFEAGAPEPGPGYELLRANPIFTPLPLATLEALARDLGERTAGAGETILAEGDVGRRYFLVASGEVEYTVAGERAGVGARGAAFGEIALLRDVPRTATVRARTRVELYTLERDDFIAAVTGYARSRAQAESVATARLGAGAGG